MACVHISETNGFSVPGSALAPKIFGIPFVKPRVSWQSFSKEPYVRRTNRRYLVDCPNQARMGGYGFGVGPATAWDGGDDYHPADLLAEPYFISFSIFPKVHDGKWKRGFQGFSFKRDGRATTRHDTTLPAFIRRCVTKMLVCRWHRDLNWTELNWIGLDWIELSCQPEVGGEWYGWEKWWNAKRDAQQARTSSPARMPRLAFPKIDKSGPHRELCACRRGWHGMSVCWSSYLSVLTV